MRVDVLVFLRQRDVSRGAVRLGVGAVIVAERLVTVDGMARRLPGAPPDGDMLPEPSYDVFLQLALPRACWLTATSQDAGWNHVHRQASSRPAVGQAAEQTAGDLVGPRSDGSATRLLAAYRISPF